MKKMIFSDEQNKIIDELVEKISRQTAEFKENELKDLIVQIIQSGDVAQYVVPGNNLYSVQYVPFMEKQQLQIKLDEAQDLLARIEDNLDFRGERDNDVYLPNELFYELSDYLDTNGLLK